ncbi:hypothetical protein VQ042_19190 [Aurantimonas sp. A2-1-M11]
MPAIAFPELKVPLSRLKARAKEYPLADQIGPVERSLAGLLMVLLAR